jgi:mono/diheme cytochrome c family protein
MKYSSLVAALLASVPLVATGLVATGLIAAGPAAAADDGAATFNSTCAGCHAENGAGDTAIGKTTGVPDLRAPQVQSQPDSRLADVIANGTGRMPGFKSTLDEQHIAALIAHVRALAKAGAPGGGGL